MTLIDNLNAIDNCKKDIKTALENKGVDMTGVAFAGYAEKINALQLESGDSESGDTPTPTPSADYIYTNAFLTGGTRKDIVNLEAYKIELNSDNTCEFKLTCPKEYTIWTGEDYDIVFTIEVPETYDIIKSVWINESNNEEITQYLKENPRYTTIERNGVIYESFIRVVEGGDMMNEVLNISDVKYIITIKKI